MTDSKGTVETTEHRNQLYATDAKGALDAVDAMDAMKAIGQQLAEIPGIGSIRNREPMAAHTSMKVGGPTDLFVTPETEEALTGAILLLRTAGIPWHLVGKGTNLIVRDGGIRGVVLHIGDAFSGIEIGEGSLVTAGAGASLSAVANAAADAGLAGLEALSGIPGSVGGALFMNAGAYGREMSDIVHSAHVYDIFNDNIITVNKEKMRLGYRVSAFQETGGILLHVTMALSADSPGAIRERMRDYRARRDGKQPMGQPSAGSFFKRPEGAYAGQLIEEAGLKGARQGGASVSEVHAGFIVNDGDASAADVLLLMARVQQTVFEQSGIHLEPEPRIIGEDAG